MSLPGWRQLAEPGGILSPAIHEQVEGKVDAAFENRGEQQVKNIARPVRVYALGGARSGEEQSRSRSAARQAFDRRPAVPNMCGDPEQEYFADGIVEDIITALSRFKSLFVIARNSSFTYKGKAVDVRQVGRELGVRYVLEGSVCARRADVCGSRSNSSTPPTASTLGRPVRWRAVDVFELQDEVTQSVVARSSRVSLAEVRRAGAKPRRISTLTIFTCGP